MAAFKMCLSLHGASEMEMATDGGVTLDRESEVEIVLLDEGCASSRLACSELSGYLKRCLGIAAPVTHEKRRTESVAFYVGALSAQDARELLQDVRPESDLGPEGLLVRARGGQIVISGADGTGVLYAAYAFIERFLGVRFMGLDSEEWVPTADSVTIPDTEIMEEPAFPLRGGTPAEFASDADFLKMIDWMARNRLNYLAFVDAELALLLKRMLGEMEARGIRVSLGGHALDSFLYDTWRLPRGEECNRIAQAKLIEHPEWHCLVRGDRVLCGRSLGHFCLTCDEAVEEFCRNVIAFVKEYPFIYGLYLCFNDARPVFCECESCRKLSLAEVIQLFYNRVAERVHELYPDLMIVSVAYADWCIPPAERTPLSSGISMDMDLWKQDYRHSIGADVPKHQRFMRLVRKWLGFAKNCEGRNPIGLAQYYCYVMCSLGPRVNVMFEDARLCRELGISAIWDCLLQYAVTYGFPKSLTAYFLARALWNPDADVDEAVDDLFNPVFGRAAPAMKEVLRISDGFGATCVAPVWWRWYQYPLDHIRDSAAEVAETLAEIDGAEGLLRAARADCESAFGVSLIEKSERWIDEARAKVSADKVYVTALEMIVARLDAGGDVTNRSFVESVSNRLMAAVTAPEKREEIVNMSPETKDRIGRAYGLPGDIARWICDLSAGEEAVLASPKSSEP